jgi:SAM-dependent methyltransferase
MTDLDRYSRTHPHFLVDELPSLLSRVARRGVIADLGAGDGRLLYALSRRHLVEKAYVVDLSPERVAAAIALSPELVGVVADATSVAEIPDGSVDGVIASQLIEHLPDDRLLAPEIARLLRPGGWWYVGSVLRSKRAWWIYRVDGRWRLDPTHVREYESIDDFVEVLDERELVTELVETTPLRFPLADLALRSFAYARLIPPDHIGALYSRSRRLKQLRRVRMRIPGFWLVEAAGRRRHPDGLGVGSGS